MAKRKKSSRVVGDDLPSYPREGGRQKRKPRAAADTEGPSRHQPQQDHSAAGTPPGTGTPIVDDAPIVLEAVLTIAEAAALKGQLLPLVNRQGEISIDGSQVESVDTAALQVLLAFVRSARAQGAAIRWTGISGALQNTAQLLGMARLIGLQA